jgi:hydrogenase-4 component H
MKTRQIRRALRALVSPAVTTRFPDTAAPRPGGFRGLPVFDEAGCVGCAACAAVCPAAAIRVSDPRPQTGPRKHRPVRVIRLAYDACHFCGRCEEKCITGRGIRLTAAFDLALLDRGLAVQTVEKELVACETCGRHLGTRAHLRWVADRLGGLSHAHPALIRIGLEWEDTPPSAAEGRIGREDLFRTLCIRCLRRVRLLEGWGPKGPRP